MDFQSLTEHVHDVLSRQYDMLKNQRSMVFLYAHIILAALFPIYIGAHASLSRPASAVKNKKEQGEDGEDTDEDEDQQIMEGLSASDAIVFPVTAGLVLATLYWLIKKYGADMVNLILAWYFAAAGIFSTAQLCSDAADLAISLVLPAYYAHAGKVFRVDPGKSQAVSLSSTRNTPLPGLLGHLPLPGRITSALWSLKRQLKQQYAVEFYVAKLQDIRGTFVIIDVFGLLCGIGAVVFNNLIAKPWWLTNIQGFAVSYFALQLISPTSFVVGSLVLSGLFFYDIWAVFFTPLMVTVATSIDQPIKLLFPRPEADKAYSMLGLGDIVLPGLMIALALRFDLFMYYQRKQSSPQAGSEVVKAVYTPVRGHWASRFWTAFVSRDALPEVLQNTIFPKPYFAAALIGYTTGMAATLIVMTVFQHAQPALLYLVPAVLSSIWGTAAVRGELKTLWSYSEELNGEASAEDKDDKAPPVDKGGSQSWWETSLAWLGFTAARNGATATVEQTDKQKEKQIDEHAGKVFHLLIKVKQSKKLVDTKKAQ